MRIIIERKGPKVLHRALERVDPHSAGRIAEADGDRIIRAYEIYLASGRTMSWWQQQPRNTLQGYRWLKIGIHLPRPTLYERINARVDEMFQRGFLEEVKTLTALHSENSPAFKAIGYRQAIDYFNGKRSLEEAVEDTKKESRRYAKRQMTWFRRDPDIRWIEGACEKENLEARAEDLVEKYLQEVGRQ